MLFRRMTTELQRWNSSLLFLYIIICNGKLLYTIDILILLRVDLYIQKRKAEAPEDPSTESLKEGGEAAPSKEEGGKKESEPPKPEGEIPKEDAPASGSKRSAEEAAMADEKKVRYT